MRIIVSDRCCINYLSDAPLPEPAIIVPMAAVAADISVKGQATQIFGSENERESKRGVPNLVKTGSMSRGVESGVICWDDNFVGWLKIELMMGKGPRAGMGRVLFIWLSGLYPLTILWLYTS